MKTYTPEQANQLLEAASGDRLEALYVLMLTSACRLGELQITAAMKDVQGHRWWGRPKTPHSRRTIPLTPLAIASLKRHKIRQAEERLARGAEWNPDQLVFTTSTGTAYSQTNFCKQQYIPMIDTLRRPCCSWKVSSHS
jgi:integrase